MTNAHTARDWSSRSAGRRKGGGQALRRRLDQRGRSGEVRHRHGQHVRLLGLGRRPLLDGLGHRPVDDARASAPDNFRAMLAGFHADGRAFPHRAVRAESAGAAGPARRLVQQFLRRADRRRAAVRAIPEALSGVSAAAHDGEQRQARHARRRAGRLPDRADLLGRAGHERPAFVLSADPSGHEADPVRLHRLLHVRSIRSAGITIC